MNIGKKKNQYNTCNTVFYSEPFGRKKDLKMKKIIALYNEPSLDETFLLRVNLSLASGVEALL